MKKIYKYPIEIVDEQTLDLPTGADVVHVGHDPGGTPCLWAIIDTDAPVVSVKILVKGTGHPLPAGEIDHLGSFLSGPFVWHLFRAPVSADQIEHAPHES